MPLDWARDIISQCQAGGIVVFVKQLGSVWARAHDASDKGADPDEWPVDLRIREFPTVTLVGV